MHYFVRSSDVDMFVNLKDYVIFLFPYDKDGKSKMRIFLCPADKVNDEGRPADD
jgi:hypothetical protein